MVKQGKSWMPPAGERGLGVEDLPVHHAPLPLPPFLSGKAFVAWLDVLGFKAFLRRSSLSEVVEAMRELDEVVEHETGRIVTAARAVHHPNEPNRRGLCETVRFSDTILVYSDNPTGMGLIRVVRATLGIIGNLMVRGVPVRGAIASGAVYIDPSAMLFIGEPLLAAHEETEQQEWAGALLVQDLEKDPSLLPAIRFLEEQKMVCRYRAPIKNGDARASLCVNWTLNYPLAPDTIYSFWNRNASSPLEGRNAQDWTKDGVRKADPTVEFATHVRTQR